MKANRTTTKIMAFVVHMCMTIVSRDTQNRTLGFIKHITNKQNSNAKNKEIILIKN